MPACSVPGRNSDLRRNEELSFFRKYCFIFFHNFRILVFTARRYASAVRVYAIALCLSQVDGLLKWLHTGSHKQNHAAR